MKETWLARLWMVASSIAVAVSMGIAAPGVAAEIDGRRVMELERARDDGDDRVQDMQMILIDKNGNQRKRSIRSYGKDVGDDDYSILFFLSPPDVRETGFLTYDYDDDDRDDDQWLYLPALKKVKRLASRQERQLHGVGLLLCGSHRPEAQQVPVPAAPRRGSPLDRKRRRDHGEGLGGGVDPY